MSRDLPEGWITRPLGDLVEFLDHMRVPVKGADRKKRRGSYPYYGANGQIDWIDDFLFDEPLILLAEDGGFFGSTEHPIAYKIEGKSWVNNHAHVLRPLTNLIDIEYLQWFLSYGNVTAFLTGSTRAKLRKGDAKKIPIVFPKSLDLQRRIAAVVEQANELRKMREEANLLPGNIVQSKFLKMFGDPLTNPQDWPVRKVEEIVEDIQPGFAFGKFSLEEGMPHLRPFNISTSGWINLSQIKYVPEEKVSQKYLLVSGDILFNNTNSEEQVGKTAVYESRSNSTFSNHLTRIRANKESATPEYIWFAFNHFYRKGIFASICKRWVNQAAVDTDQLKNLEIPIPPIRDQMKFSSFITKIQILMNRQRKSTLNLAKLFHSLRHKAFRGELAA